MYFQAYLYFFTQETPFFFFFNEAVVLGLMLDISNHRSHIIWVPLPSPPCPSPPSPHSGHRFLQICYLSPDLGMLLYHHIIFWKIVLYFGRFSVLFSIWRRIALIYPCGRNHEIWSQKILIQFPALLFVSFWTGHSLQVRFLYC